MSTFEKSIIPLIDDSILSIDLTPAAGFIDSYTKDPDRPSDSGELFLVYDDTKRNDFVSDRMRRFEKSPYLKRIYVKYVNNIPYYIYSFWVKPEIKQKYNGVITFTPVQKARILQFWGPFDKIVESVLNNQVLTLDVQHSMPLADYNGSFLETA